MSTRSVVTIPEKPGAQAESSTALSLLQKLSSFPVMMGAFLVIGAEAAARFNLPDPDTWWHLAVGNHIWATHTLPVADRYSFTAHGAPWIAYEWLGEALMGAVSHLSFLRGPEALLLLLAAVFTILLYRYATLVSGNSKAAFVGCAVLLPVTCVFFTLRPQLIGYIFLAATLILLERYRQGSMKHLWALPPLFLVWVNTHGSFVLGLGVIGIYWICGVVDFQSGSIHSERWTPRQSRHILTVLLLSVVALTITPYGTRLAAYPLQMALSQPLNLAHIVEWQAISFQFWQTKLVLVLVLLFWLAHVPLPMEYRLETVILLLLATYASFVHRRFTPFLLLIFVPLLARMIARWIPPYDRAIDKYAFNAGLILLIAFGVYKVFPSTKKLNKLIKGRYPEAAVEYLRDHHVPGPTLNEYGWGGYLIWSREYDRKVFVDGRADFYEYAGVLGDYFDIADVKPDTLFLVKKYGVESCLLGHDSPLATLLRAQPDWKEVYQDKKSVILVRQQ